MSWPRKGLLMVGPYGHYHPYEYDEAMVLVQDCDCVRVISDTTHEVLQRVPPSTEAIRQIGSDAPGALLFDAMDSFDHADAKGAVVRALHVRTLVAVHDTLMQLWVNRLLVLSHGSRRHDSIAARGWRVAPGSA